MTAPLLDLVDRRLIAERLGVKVETVDQWRIREVMPPPDFPDLHSPVWHWTTIEDWAKATGRA